MEKRRGLRPTPTATGLEVSREITLFPEADAFEYILLLRNTGTVGIPIIEKILPLDLQFAAAKKANPLTRVLSVPHQ